MYPLTIIIIIYHIHDLLSLRPSVLLDLECTLGDNQLVIKCDLSNNPAPHIDLVTIMLCLSFLLVNA